MPPIPNSPTGEEISDMSVASMLGADTSADDGAEHMQPEEDGAPGTSEPAGTAQQPFGPGPLADRMTVSAQPAVDRAAMVSRSIMSLRHHIEVAQDIEVPELLTFNQWLTWRSGPGRRPRSGLDSCSTTNREESELWRSTMAMVHGPEWQEVLLQMKENDRVLLWYLPQASSLQSYLCSSV